MYKTTSIHIMQLKNKGGNKFIFMFIICRRNNMTRKMSGGGGWGRERKTHLCARVHTHTHKMERKE